MPNVFIYVVDRDFGFAPNPYHGFCTLATCKPRIRNSARIHDWVIGIGGSRLKATGHCIFAMEVTDRVSFDEYWSNPKFSEKKPIRNGSAKMLVGDNIYHSAGGEWHQADSHHSFEGGTPNEINIKKDTSANSVLISRNFYYFGNEALKLDPKILSSIGYKNGRSHRKFDLPKVRAIIEALGKFPNNQVFSDPFDFHIASSRYSGIGSKVK